MFQPHYGICICHNEKRLIVVKKGYCQQGNYEQKQAKKKKKPIYISVKQKVKPTGEREIFLEIWNERPHVCENCLEYLGSEAKAHFFAHLLSKKQHPELRLDKDNIVLLCFDCHYQLDHGTIDKFIELNKNKKFLETEVMIIIIDKRKRL